MTVEFSVKSTKMKENRPTVEAFTLYSEQCRLINYNFFLKFRSFGIQVADPVFAYRPRQVSVLNFILFYHLNSCRKTKPIRSSKEEVSHSNTSETLRWSSIVKVGGITLWLYCARNWYHKVFGCCLANLLSIGAV